MASKSVSEIARDPAEMCLHGEPQQTCIITWELSYIIRGKSYEDVFKKCSLPSKRSRTTRTKFGPRERGFRIRAARKIGREQKGGRSGVGEGKEGSLLFPPPPLSFHFFALSSFFVQPECEKTPSCGPNSFAWYGNACYAG